MEGEAGNTVRADGLGEGEEGGEDDGSEKSNIQQHIDCPKRVKIRTGSVLDILEAARPYIWTGLNRGSDPAPIQSNNITASNGMCHEFDLSRLYSILSISKSLQD